MCFAAGPGIFFFLKREKTIILKFRLVQVDLGSDWSETRTGPGLIKNKGSHDPGWPNQLGRLTWWPGWPGTIQSKTRL